MAEDQTKKNKVVGVSAVFASSTTMSATAKSRTNLAVQHIFAAAYSSRKADEMEVANAGKPFGDFYEEIVWNVSAAVLFAVASLEADVNEIFVDANINLGEYDKEILDEIWNLIEMKSILDKYEMALFLKKKERFDKSDPAYQDAANLIKLRNALVHFKPEWSDEKKEHKKIEDRLRGKFKLSPFLPPETEFFPKKCMSHGCAEWAVKTALAFRTFFSDKAGLSDRFAPYVGRLNTRQSVT
jgi:hypothetical protein